jgi:hypothetical protein
MSIAKKQLVNEEKYTEIVKLSKDKYTSLEINPRYLEIGWELIISCPEVKEKAGEEIATATYTVKVKVVDTNKNPVKGAKVTLYSEPKEAFTNEKGIATFEDAAKGEHKIVIAYKGQVGEQKVNLGGEVKEFNFTIQIKQTNPLVSPLVISIIGTLILIIAGLSIWIYKMRRKGVVS